MGYREDLIAQLIRHEGLRLWPYTDTVGKLSIGVGRNLTDVGISREEAIELLNNDIDKAVAECATYPWFTTLDAVRQRVIVDMIFNLGARRFKSFKRLIAAMARGDYEAASVCMLDSMWAEQVGKRALRLAEMMRSGLEQP